MARAQSGAVVGTIVSTDRGAVQGTVSGEALAFLGIPYAAPPVGPRRFTPPAPAPIWSTPHVSAWGPCCPQLSEDHVLGQEDCLTLNVWTPSSPAPLPSKNGGRPVLVYLHGGSNIEGCSASAIHGGEHTFEGDRLAAHNGVVVVTLNYRIGALGFVAHAALGAGGTNLGLRDQLAALAWVQKNIRAFGGDPARVLLFGESAGATDTCALMASPRAKGLFARALMESGQCNGIVLATAQKLALDNANAVGCNGPDIPGCLRAASAESLVKAAGAVTGKLGEYGPVVDGDILPAAPDATIAAGHHNHMPFVIGDNSAEVLFWTRFAPVADEAAYKKRLEIFGHPLAESVLQRYPLSAYAEPTDAYVAALTDQHFLCPARRVARAAAAAQHEPVYRYLFTHALKTRRRPVAHGAMHGIELLFVFGKLHPLGYQPTPTEETLSTTLMDYWAHFAATGQADAPGHPAWSAFRAGGDDYLVLDEAQHMASGLHSEACDFWDGIEALNAATAKHK